MDGAKRVLVVDDEPLIRQLVADFLIEAGYQVDTAANGAEALLRDGPSPARCRGPRPDDAAPGRQWLRPPAAPQPAAFSGAGDRHDRRLQRRPGGAPAG